MNENVDNPMNIDDSWKESLAGEDQGRMEALSKYQSPDELFNTLDQAQNYDWRSAAAGEDDKFKSQLERFDSLGSFANSFREAQQKISSGQLKDPLPADASEDQIRSYREANGIPLESTGYTENLPDGLVLGEEDKEIFSSFADALHSANAPPEIAHKAVEWYNSFAQEQQDAQADADHQHHQETEDKLRQEWGTDYRQNINLVGAMIEKTFGQDGKDAILNARGPDGRALMNNPAILGAFAELSRGIMHPMSMPGQGDQDPQQTVDNEISEIEKFMRTNRSEYNKDEKMQGRLRQLYEIRAKHQAA